MPIVHVNDIDVNYVLEGGEGGELVVLVNGLADDLQTWDYQIGDLREAGFSILRYDNRGVGLSSRPIGPYTSAQLATDLHALLVHLKTTSFHLLGVSMGGMIVQSYALLYPNDSAPPSLSSSTSSSSSLPNPAQPQSQSQPHLLSLTLACTYAHPSPFCARMFALWADMARSSGMGVRAVMRDVLLWAFTVPFFVHREAEVREVETAMQGLDMSTETYLAQLNVIREFDSRGALGALQEGGRTLGGLGRGRVCVLVGEEDILIPMLLSRELRDLVGGEWRSTRGGHGCMWEFPEEFNRTYIEFLKGIGE